MTINAIDTQKTSFATKVEAPQKPVIKEPIEQIKPETSKPDAQPAFKLEISQQAQKSYSEYSEKLESAQLPLEPFQNTEKMMKEQEAATERAISRKEFQQEQAERKARMEEVQQEILAQIGPKQAQTYEKTQQIAAAAPGELFSAAG